MKQVEFVCDFFFSFSQYHIYGIAYIICIINKENCLVSRSNWYSLFCQNTKPISSGLILLSINGNLAKELIGTLKGPHILAWIFILLQFLTRGPTQMLTRLVPLMREDPPEIAASSQLGNLIHQKQHAVSRSLIKSQYRALAHTTTEVYRTWLKSLFTKLGMKVLSYSYSTTWCDNIGTNSVASNPVFFTLEQNILKLTFILFKIKLEAKRLQFTM